jgi:hypothetical protein
MKKNFSLLEWSQQAEIEAYIQVVRSNKAKGYREIIFIFILLNKVFPFRLEHAVQNKFSVAVVVATFLSLQGVDFMKLHSGRKVFSINIFYKNLGQSFI